MSPEMHRLHARILGERAVRGPVLEIGATADRMSLMNLPELSHIGERIGINLDPQQQAEGMMQVNANNMDVFPDGHFGLVMCNSVLEHDRFFWKSIAEMKRVTASGGLIMIGVPSYGDMDDWRAHLGNSFFSKSLIKLLTWSRPEIMRAATMTLGRHAFPDDYYRFSKSLVRDYFMDGLIEVQLHQCMSPPRVLAVGVKP